jgi:hypothetical protein
MEPNMTDSKTMTDEERKTTLTDFTPTGRYYEAAERGYDAKGTNAASQRHIEAKTELALRKCRKVAQPFCEMIAVLAGESKA